MSRRNWFIMGTVAGLVAAAIGQELQKPEGDRAWRGKIAGIPYNFKVNDWRDIVREYWNPESDRVFSPHAFGLGWGLNLAALTRSVRTLSEPPQDHPERETVER